MLLETAKELSKVDKDMEVTCRYDGEEITLGVRLPKVGEMYSYTSHDVVDAFERLTKYCRAIVDVDKWEEFLDEVFYQDFETEEM